MVVLTHLRTDCKRALSCKILFKIRSLQLEMELESAIFMRFTLDDILIRFAFSNIFCHYFPTKTTLEEIRFFANLKRFGRWNEQEKSAKKISKFFFVF